MIIFVLLIIWAICGTQWAHKRFAILDSIKETVPTRVLLLTIFLGGPVIWCCTIVALASVFFEED